MAACVRIIALGLGIVLMVGGPVAAAPQILGLVATAKPLPLTCADGVCAAEFSVFCLQKYRTSPMAGAEYRATQDTALTLTYTDRVGEKRSVSVGNLVIIKAHRGNYAVRIAIQEGEIRGLGGRDAAISVGALASLVPIAQAGDTAPLDDLEIAYVTGPHRAAVAREFNDDRAPTVALQTVNRLINALPQGRTTPSRRRALWRQVIGDVPTRHSETGVRRAAREFQFCKRWADTGRGYGLRFCLEEYHDLKANDLTEKAWKVSEPGS